MCVRARAWGLRPATTTPVECRVAVALPSATHATRHQSSRVAACESLAGWSSLPLTLRAPEGNLNRFNILQPVGQLEHSARPSQPC